MKFGSNFFLKIIGTDHLISKKNGRRKWTFKTNFKAAIYITRVFHFNPLSFNSTIFLKKKHAIGFKS